MPRACLRGFVACAGVLACPALFLLVTTTLAAAEPAPAPALAAPILGPAHVWLKGGWNQAYGHGSADWGLGNEGWLALEGFWGSHGKGWYGGLEIGRLAKTDTANDQGDTIDGFDYWWLEFNAKKAFGLQHGMAIDVGLGASILYVDGEEHLVGQTGTEPLADLGFGWQGFSDLTWRRRHLLLGVGLKYAWTYDVVKVGYANLRLAAQVGFIF